MKRILFSLLLFSIVKTALCTTWIINSSGFTFTPSSLTITLGDDVNFTLESIHRVVEVSQATWNANGNTALASGFQTPFGGGIVPSSKLGLGTHYYVCEPHALSGMKGIIIVQNVSATDENKQHTDFSVYPNPSGNLLTIKANINLIGSQYIITDQTGRQVFKGKLVNETTQSNISELKSGMYLLQIAGQRRQSLKFIKN